WNTNAYESVGMLRDMEGIVDIYLPDFKYGIEEIGYKYSGIKNYPDIAEKAIEEMLKQTGHLMTKKGIAYKGIIIRHMVLPNNLDNSFRALDILAKIDNSMHIGLMSQYFPLYHADKYAEINRPITFEEWKKVNDYMESLGFENGWTQELDSSSMYIPDFNKKNPFNP
ncbi:MAG: radical SAM protein, partial [Candidatus Gracilibacteria bacterium]